MKETSLIISLLTGLMLGFAQCTSRLFLLSKSTTSGLLLGGLTAVLYILAAIQWAKVLKSPVDLSGAYAIVVLGVFTGISIANALNLQRSANLSIQNIAGIALIVVGSALIKR